LHWPDFPVDETGEIVGMADDGDDGTTGRLAAASDNDCSKTFGCFLIHPNVDCHLIFMTFP